MKAISVLTMSLAVGGLTAVASADITDFTVTSSTSSAVPGYIVNDLYVSFTGQLTDNQVLISGLSDGDIYQDEAGTNTAPSSTFVGIIPSLGDDTFVQFGSALSNDGGSIVPSFAGGAVDIGGGAALVFNSATIDAAYFISGGSSVTDQEDYFVGRITLSESANGTFSFLANTNAPGLSTFDLVIVDGAIVPEPASLALLGLGGLALVGRSRRA